MKKKINIIFPVLSLLMISFLSVDAYSQSNCEVDNAKIAIKSVKSKYKSHPNIKMIDLPGKLGFFEIKLAYINDGNAIKLAEDMNLLSLTIFTDLAKDCPSIEETSSDKNVSSNAAVSKSAGSSKPPTSSATYKNIVSVNGSCRSCPKNSNFGNQTNN